MGRFAFGAYFAGRPIQKYMPIIGCNCLPCVRRKIKASNRYWVKKKMLDRVMPVPLIPENFIQEQCPCYSCQTRKNYKRNWDKVTERGTKKIRIVAAYSPIFNPIGPNRYEWDRTTWRDYGHRENDGRDKQESNRISSIA